jgi:hypothetical protein
MNSPPHQPERDRYISYYWSLVPVRLDGHGRADPGRNVISHGPTLNVPRDSPSVTVRWLPYQRSSRRGGTENYETRVTDSALESFAPKALEFQTLNEAISSIEDVFFH